LWLARSSVQIQHPFGPNPAVAGRRDPVLGRGLSRASAIEGCRAEAIERYSLYPSGSERLIRRSYRKLDGEAIHPHQLLLFSDRQYGERAAWNRAGATPWWVPPRFKESSVIEWVRAESLSGKPARLVPADYCYYRGLPFFCVPNSNGCAAGRTLQDAILTGLLELIERDAVAIWWYNRIPRPTPDIAIAGLQELHGIEDFLRFHHRSIRTFDITADLGIPVMAAVTALPDGREMLMGAACHPDPAVALAKAVMEAGQMLIAVNRWGRVDRKDFPFAEEWFDTALWDAEPHLSVLRESGRIVRVPGAISHLEDALAALARAGLSAYYVDLTRAELGLRVVRVVAPQLRFWAPRFAPGRLYDVPVQMGWLRRRRSEGDLNKWPWFL
jgi:ribosomal protein S12 methylthiotransferase accessory factor